MHANGDQCSRFLRTEWQNGKSVSKRGNRVLTGNVDLRAQVVAWNRLRPSQQRVHATLRTFHLTHSNSTRSSCTRMCFHRHTATRLLARSINFEAIYVIHFLDNIYYSNSILTFLPLVFLLLLINNSIGNKWYFDMKNENKKSYNLHIWLCELRCYIIQ